ncbi:hypothetical protein K440DRAFT_591220, partial [Wilcoxina mikolae CBS 423.85]
EFADYFGYGEEGELEKWQLLCEVLGVDTEGLPATKTQYQKALRDIHVNIFDLLQHVRTGATGQVRRFETVRELARYSKNSKKIYPKEQAKGSALRFLLRHIFGSSREE